MFHFDPVVIVVMDVIPDAVLPALRALEPVEMEELGFQHRTDAIHGCVVEAVALARHALDDVPLLQLALISCHLVVPALSECTIGFSPLANFSKALESMFSTSLKPGRRAVSKAMISPLKRSMTGER